MKNGLEARRQKLLQEIARVDREIGSTQKRIGRINSDIAAIERSRAKAA